MADAMNGEGNLRAAEPRLDEEVRQVPLARFRRNVIEAWRSIYLYVLVSSKSCASQSRWLFSLATNTGIYRL
jgi:hypothetical protein